MENLLFNLPNNMNSSRKMSLSSEGSWKLSICSDTSLTSANHVQEFSRPVDAIDTVRIVKPINTRSISATESDEPVTDEESNDPQSIDLQSIDEPATEEEPPAKPVIDEEPPTETVIDEEPLTGTVIDEEPLTGTVIYEEPSTVPVNETCGHLSRERLSQRLLAFNYTYNSDSCDDLQYFYDEDVTYKQPVKAKVVNRKQVHASNARGDMGNPGQIRFRNGAPANAKTMCNDKFGKLVGSGDTMKRESLVAAQRKSVVAKKTLKDKNDLIKNVYMSQTNKVSMKPAPFQRRSSSYINRQAMQRKTDQNNLKIMKKLMNVKATVSSFR